MSYENMTKDQAKTLVTFNVLEDNVYAPTVHAYSLLTYQEHKTIADRQEKGKQAKRPKHKPDGARIARRRYNVGKIWAALDVNERTEQLAEDAYRLKDATSGDLKGAPIATPLGNEDGTKKTAAKISEIDDSVKLATAVTKSATMVRKAAAEKNKNKNKNTPKQKTMRQRVDELIAAASDQEEKNAGKAAEAEATLRQLVDQLNAWKKKLEEANV